MSTRARRIILALLLLLTVLVALLLLGPCPPGKPVPASWPPVETPPIVNHEAPPTK
mgnify:CR=1